MNDVTHIVEIIADNPVYLILAVSLAVMIVWSLIKKLYKLAIIFAICCIIYLFYIYIENPEKIKKQAKEVFDQGKEPWDYMKKEGGKIINKIIEEAD